MLTNHKLHVIWRAPTPRGSRHVVGTLTREADGYRFDYQADGVALAGTEGFDAIPGLPLAQASHHSGYLFAIFQERLPSPARSDFGRMMDSWGVADRDDHIEVLARSGGILATDRLELTEFRSADDDLSNPLEYRIAGMQKRPSASATIVTGAPLKLQREPDNESDPLATMVAQIDGISVGYVPRQYAALIARHLDARHPLTTIAVRKILLPEDIGAWVVRTCREQPKR